MSPSIRPSAFAFAAWSGRSIFVRKAQYLALAEALDDRFDAEPLAERVDQVARHRHHRDNAQRIVGIVRPFRRLP